MGFLVNQFIGKPSQYLATGGGMKIDFCYSSRKDFLYGLNINFYGNSTKKEYPINLPREQSESRSTLLNGLIFGKRYNKFSVQGELQFSLQNIAERLSDDDPDATQLRGWATGVVATYPLKIGKMIPSYSYAGPVLMQNNLVVQAGLRYLKFPLQEATGLMLELGVSYDMSYRTVSKYNLKDEFLNK
jgi:hypothetical protein